MRLYCPTYLIFNHCILFIINVIYIIWRRLYEKSNYCDVGVHPIFEHHAFLIHFLYIQLFFKVLKDSIVKTISLLSTPIYVLFGMQKYISSVILLENDKWTKISAFEILKFLVQLKTLSSFFNYILNNQTWFYSLGIFHFFLLISYEFVSKIS